MGVLHSRATGPYGGHLHCKSGRSVFSLHYRSQMSCLLFRVKTALGHLIWLQASIHLFIYTSGITEGMCDICTVSVMTKNMSKCCNTHKKDFVFQLIKLLLIRIQKACLCHSFTSNSFAHWELFLWTHCLIVDYVTSLCVSVCVHINPV